MSGHSKWAVIKHKKAAIDAKRGKLSVYLIKNIEVTARIGDGDPVGNSTLFDAIQKAKKNPAPADNITRAVKRGPGAEAGSMNYETTMYEGCGPGSVAFYVEYPTDNRNRAASGVRPAFARSGGSMANPGLVAFLFFRRGIVEVAVAEGVDGDSIMEAALEARAEEAGDLGGSFAIESDPSDAVEIHKALQAAGIDYDSAGVQFVAATGVELDPEDAVKVQCFIDVLEDSDDVQNIYHNMMVLDEVWAQFEEKE